MLRSSWGRVSASASRISWSRALRRSGLEIVSRATASAGRSRRSLPPASCASTPLPLLQHHEDVAFADALALLAADLLDDAVVLGLDRDLHLHRLKDDDGVPVGDLVADRDLDFPDVAGDVCLDLCHGRGQ